MGSAIVRKLAFVGALCAACVLGGNERSHAQTAPASGQAALSRGDFEAARHAFDASAETARSAGNLRGQAEALGGAGLAALGMRDRDTALGRFGQSVTVATAASAADLAALGAFNYAVATPGASLGARASAAWHLGASPPLDGADVSAARDSAQAFASASGFAQAANLPLLAGRAQAHRAQLAMATGDAATAQAAIDAAIVELRTTAPGQPRVAAANLIADASLMVAEQGSASAQVVAAEAAQIALADARTSNDRLGEAAAKGLLGRLYALRGRGEEALALTREAIWLADRAHAPDHLFAWQGQYARLLQAKGDMAGALAAYQSSARSIAAARPLLARATPLDGRWSYREAIDPILLSYADLLLRSGRGDEGVRLREVRALVDNLKTLELDQYFNDACILQTVSGEVAVDRVSSRAAVVYPILFADRVELIITTGDHVERRSAAKAVGRADIEAAVNRLSATLRDDKVPYDFADAQLLYDVLLRPAEDIFARDKIDTLVITPDGPLRRVPMAALHDGRQFVIERFAVSTQIGLALVDPRPIAPGERRGVIAGLSESVPLPTMDAAGQPRMAPALGGVPGEVKAVRAIMPGPLLLDKTFTTAGFAQTLDRERFSVAHLATHATFGATSAETFILTHDGKISLDELGGMMERARTRGQSLELLVLSACETAVGDDRAVLGIAGAAYRSGARSVLASLWIIPDAPTAQLMPDFYRGLTLGHSKAQALRDAQLSILGSSETAHPYNWAAFVLVGNWL